MVGVTTDRTLPLQGGLPPAAGLRGPVVEIACDESGFSGTNLLDSATPVFAHASVDLGVDEAAGLVDTLRSGFRWSLSEPKSGQFLRDPRADEAVAWMLAALRDRAHVLVVDKEYFLATRVVDLFLVEPSYAAGTRLTRGHRAAADLLHRAGRAADREWGTFLEAFVDLVRTKRRPEPDAGALESFLRARDSLAGAVAGNGAGDVLAGLDRARVSAVVRRLVDGDRAIPPPLEPLLPALAETVLHWSGGTRQVLVVHDEQSALTASRLRRLQQALSVDPCPGEAADDLEAWAARVSPLAGLVAVDSRDDPRVQVADLLAGVARRSPDLHADRLRPLLSPTSLRAPQP
jgi:hypothetical protein